MALWGGRFKFEEKSVTHRDYDYPGAGIRADYPGVPPGVFVGKYGEALRETTFHADYQPKTKVPNPPYSSKFNLRVPQPLKSQSAKEEVALESESDAAVLEWSPATEQMWPAEDDSEWPPATEEAWPAEDVPEWLLPAPRQPYHHFTNLRMSGRRERLTSTYTEDLGTVRPGEVADIGLPPPGLLPWGRPIVRTEYHDEFSALKLRPPHYVPPGTRVTRVRGTCPHWETSYRAMCREFLEAPNWVRDFLAASPRALEAPHVPEQPWNRHV